jgi:hypothetical protein
MALFRADHDTENTLQRSNRIAVIVASIAGIALGCFFAYDLTRLPSGYLAGYLTAAVLATEVLLTLIGALLLPFWRTRWLGVGLIVAGFLSLAAYEVGSNALLRFDLVPWRPPSIDLVPGQQARVVIHFKSDVTEQQVNEFMSSKLRFMPNWAYSLERPTMETDGRLTLALTVSDTAFGGKRASARQSKMLAENVSGFMVVMRRDPRVSSVELRREP